MKLLLFSDIHANPEHCRNLVQKSDEVDQVIGAGDIGHLRTRLKETISILRKIRRRTILVPGNGESYEELKAACRVWKEAVVLHGDSINIDGKEFFGVGGGIPVTPFGSWSWDFNEYQAAQLLENCPENSILISNSPPKEHLDVSSSGQSLGSTAVRDIIIAKNPLLVVCGHIHESSGKIEKFGVSTIINAGPHGIVYEI